MIATSTPELKRLIEDEEMINIRKNRAKGTKRKLSIGVTQTLLSSSSSDSECDMVGLLDDLLHHSDEDLTRSTFLKDDYVVVRFECKTMAKHYVGIVHDDTDKHELEVKFLRKWICFSR